jgi:hypothetical protein
MIQLSNNQKTQIVEALLEQRKNFDGTDEQFSQSFGINYSVYSRLKSTKNFDGLLRDNKWVDLGYELNVEVNRPRWNIVKTEVYQMIEEEILFCKQNAKSRICVDNSDIGKTTAAKHLSKSLKNCFYIDMSQCSGKIEFIRTLAKAVGVNPNGKIAELKAKTKYMLRILPEPVVILDEAGDMKYETFLICKEYWNGTESACGWYMIGADALREWIERGKRNRKVGFYEMFNRYGANYTVITPTDNREKLQFYKKLVTDVVKANLKDKNQLNSIVAKALVKNEDTGEYSGLRRIESVLILNK